MFCVFKVLFQYWLSVWPLGIYWLESPQVFVFPWKLFFLVVKSVLSYACSYRLSAKNSKGILTYISGIPSRESPHYSNSTQIIVSLTFQLWCMFHQLCDVAGFCLAFLLPELQSVYYIKRPECWRVLTDLFCFSTCCLLYNVKNRCFPYFVCFCNCLFLVSNLGRFSA